MKCCFLHSTAHSTEVSQHTERTPCSRLLTIAVSAGISWNTVVLHPALCFIIWKLETSNNYTKLYELSPPHSHLDKADISRSCTYLWAAALALVQCEYHIGHDKHRVLLLSMQNKEEA